MKIWLLLAMVLTILVGGFYWWSRPMTKPSPPQPEARLPAPCERLVFEAVNYIVCTVDADDLSLKRADPAGKPYGNLAALADEMPFMLAMNAGMYHEDLGPVGLYVEGGVEYEPLNRADAPGNFFMKPNGVFYVDRNGHAGVMETEGYASSGIEPELATQSGPMLVIDGQIHPRFEENGKSRHIRNGVGVDENGRVVLAISYQPVSLGSFARLFRDALGTRNALFFDGAISALHDGKKYLVGGRHPAGPILAVTAKAKR